MGAAVALTAESAVEPTITDLLVTVEREHQLAMQAARGVLAHAIAAGRALLQIREQVPDGQWKAWVDEHSPVHWSTANDYMRAAHFSGVLEESGVKSLDEALGFLHGHIRNRKRPGRAGLPDLKKKALALHREGATQREIAERLGVSKSTLYWWLNPGAKQRHLKKLSDAKKAAAREQEQRQARTVKRVARERGGAISELYAMAERMQDVIGRAHDEATDPEARRALARAGAHYRRMRDDIVTALGAQ
jgi:transposase